MAPCVWLTGTLPSISQTWGARSRRLSAISQAHQVAGYPMPTKEHSVRAGAAGVSERAIIAQTGHKSMPLVRCSIRGGSLFREKAAEVG